ncbi:MAG TPA: acyl-CoA dehydrogenase family protein [Streptosporangiaceae bacterium]|jgi:alkylation response protein AidB-like acyl-CoA dehydrogenase|nr:acyl-CoA dehydrogenase family protein [Streptosporangiaceae bacterium]
MDFTWTEEEDALRGDLRAYIEDRLMPGWTHTDRDMPTQATIDEVIAFCRGLAERGLLTPAWPAEYGGRGASLWEQTVISEELWGVGEPRGPQYMNVNWIGPAINQIGSEEQRQRYFGPIAAGEAMWCQGFSEPDAGSDLSALKTSAERDGDVYVVNGQKIWTSYAHAADYCFLLVRTARTDNPRRGISVLLVPMDLPGIEVREIPTLGVRHLVHEVFFTDVAVPVACRLGGENEGWNIIRQLLASERVGNARHEWVDRSLDKLVDEVLDGGRADTEDPRVWETLGRAAAWTAASRVLNYAAVQAWSDASSEYPNLAATYRTSMAQMELGVAYAFIDVLGPEALLESSRGDYQLVGGTLSTIGGGSLEMQLNNVAWYQLGLPKG